MNAKSLFTLMLVAVLLTLNIIEVSAPAHASPVMVERSGQFVSPTVVPTTYGVRQAGEFPVMCFDPLLTNTVILSAGCGQGKAAVQETTADRQDKTTMKTTANDGGNGGGKDNGNGGNGGNGGGTDHGNNGNHYGNDKPDNNDKDVKNKHNGEDTAEEHHNH